MSTTTSASGKRALSLPQGLLLRWSIQVFTALRLRVLEFQVYFLGKVDMCPFRFSLGLQVLLGLRESGDRHWVFASKELSIR